MQMQTEFKRLGYIYTYISKLGQINGNTVLKFRAQSAVKLMSRETRLYKISVKGVSNRSASVRISYTPCRATRQNKVKVSLEQAMKAQRGSRGIFLLFL